MRLITAYQFRQLSKIPRDRFSVRIKVFVGAIVVKNDRILLVDDSGDKREGWDLPGGKLLWSEMLKSAILREVAEETGYKVKLSGLLGIYQRKTGVDDEDYLRIIFIADLKNTYQRKIRDPKIKQAKWWKLSDISANQIPLRSPEVAREIADFQRGIQFPLSLIKTYVW